MKKIRISKNSWHYKIWKSTFCYGILGMEPVCSWLCNQYWKVNIPAKPTLCNYAWRIIFAPLFWMTWLVTSVAAAIVMGIFFTIFGIPMLCCRISEKKKYKRRNLLLEQMMATGDYAHWYLAEWELDKIEDEAKSEGKFTGFMTLLFVTFKAWKEKHCPLIEVDSSESDDTK